MQKYLVRLPMALKAARELGARQVFWYAVYQSGLRSGIARRATPIGAYKPLPYAVHGPFTHPTRQQLETLLGENLRQAALELADEVTAGQVRLFGGPLAALNLIPKDATHHWSYFEGRPATWGVEDIKTIWEPARFGWAYTLARAYCLSADEKYPAAFWKHFETFLKSNPPNCGPNWSSAQEVALRLLAWFFAAQVFAESAESTDERMAVLAGAIAAHAERIPPTLSYARAQENNHRITEALGLYAAGCVLPEHPKAQQWQQKGWDELNRALQTQIARDGTYAQHSMNYHRLMLHAALQGQIFGRPYPPETLHRLSAATDWLVAQVDPLTGGAPNLGSNDGANILPLSAGDFRDFRPVAQAASRAFLGRPAFPPGPWDEPGMWLGQVFRAHPARKQPPFSPAFHRLGDQESWATLRAVRFTSRPSHADQLHVDLWWHGFNVAMDAGTYCYTAAAPWDNSLAQTFVHNTLEVNGQNQMQRAGRFLWLDWAQAALLNTRNYGANAVAAQQDGYQHLGVLHRRVLKRDNPNHWQVIDHVLRARTLRLDVPHNPIYPIRLHWLLPDGEWRLEGTTLFLSLPHGAQLRLRLFAELPSSPIGRVEYISLARAGEALSGHKKISPVMGWFSPTYGVKIPALSFSMTVQSPLPFTLTSDFTFQPAPES